MEFLGIASRSVKYDMYTGQALSITTFDKDRDIKATQEGIRLVLHIDDKVTALSITQEKDFLNKLYRETRKNHRIRRETRFYFEESFIDGFGAATRSETFDSITGLRISKSEFKDFN